VTGFDSDEVPELAKLRLSDGIKSCRKVVRDYQAALLKPGSKSRVGKTDSH